MSADRPRETHASESPARRGKSEKTVRERLDTLMVSSGLAPSRERARALIMAGEVQADGKAATKAGTLVPTSAVITLVGAAAELRFVSRGGLKLERALDAWRLDPTDQVCLDVGASTGGFTDVLLRRGARRVYSVDVGHGQLAWTLRTDPRVVVMDRVNIRRLNSLPEPITATVIDVSFISLRLVLEPVAALMDKDAANSWVVALVKPQFEAGRAEANRGAGVISDPAVHGRVLHDLLRWLADWRERSPEHALLPQAVIPSPIAGRDGNHEYLLWLAPATDAAASSTLASSSTDARERIVALAVTAAFTDTGKDSAAPTAPTSDITQ